MIILIEEGVKALNNNKKKILILILIILINLINISCGKNIKTKNDNYYIEKADYYYDKKKFKKSVKYINKAIKINKNDHYYFYYRGLCYIKLKKYKKAKNNFKKSLSIQNSHDANHNLGFVLLQMNDFYNSIKYYSNAIILDNKEKRNYNGRGLAYYSIHENIKAIDDFTKAIELDNNYIIAYINRGLTYEKIGKYDKAIEDYKKVISIDKSNLNALDKITWYYLGDLHNFSVDNKKKYPHVDYKEAFFWANLLLDELNKRQAFIDKEEKKKYADYYKTVCETYLYNQPSFDTDYMKNQLDILKRGEKLNPKDNYFKDNYKWIKKTIRELEKGKYKKEQEILNKNR